MCLFSAHVFKYKYASPYKDGPADYRKRYLLLIKWTQINDVYVTNTKKIWKLRSLTIKFKIS